MSFDLAKAYIEKIKTDEVFAKKVNSFEDKAVCLDFVVQSGYSFTKEEFEKASSELYEKELDSVVGGQSRMGHIPNYPWYN